LFMDPFDAAWSILKELNPAFQDDPNAAEEDMRHFQTMQNMNEMYTPRGNTNPKYIQQNAGAKPTQFFGDAFYEKNPWTESADLNYQADNSRNPGDARRFREQATAIDAHNAMAAESPGEHSLPLSDEPTGPMTDADFDELDQILSNALRSRAPLSYRRKIKPLSDQEVRRDLSRLRNFRR